MLFLKSQTDQKSVWLFFITSLRSHEYAKTEPESSCSIYNLTPEILVFKVGGKGYSVPFKKR